MSGLSKVYTEGDAAAINKYSSVTDYDGSTEAIRIYKLQSTNELIADEDTRLIGALSAPEITGDPLEFSASAYALKGSLLVDGKERTVILFSLQNPICVLKNRFLYDEGTFTELNKKVLNLRQNIDVIMIDDSVYLLTLAGEKLFNMERSYKDVCVSKAQDICESGIITDIDVFKTIATSGHNPRRFVAFNQNRFERMKDAGTRREMAATFNLPMNAEGLIDTSTASTAEKLVKLLCNKGMLDPFDNVVSASNIGYTKARERSQGKGGDLRSKYNLTLTVVRKQYNGRGLFGKPCRTALGTLSCGAPVSAGFTT